MTRLKRNIIPAATIVGFVASMVLLYQARASLRERAGQVQRLRERMAQLEAEVARLSSTDQMGLPPDELEAYLSLGYKEFDATPGSGHRRFRDQPRHFSQSGELIETYLERHPELLPDQRNTLHYHAAQLFAMGGRNERAITHLDSISAHRPGSHVADATKAFLLFDREGLVAARQRMADGDPAKEIVDFLIERFGESYADGVRWNPICSKVTVPEGASLDHRAAADRLAKAFGLAITVAPNGVIEGGIPGDCIWLEVRPMGGTPDVEGYIILHALKSTVITASNQDRLNAAVKRFIETSRQRNGKREARFGLATSFELAR